MNLVEPAKFNKNLMGIVPLVCIPATTWLDLACCGRQSRIVCLHEFMVLLYF